MKETNVNDLVQNHIQEQQLLTYTIFPKYMQEMTTPHPKGLTLMRQILASLGVGFLTKSHSTAFD